jgi:hypothetical protein
VQRSILFFREEDNRKKKSLVIKGMAIENHLFELFLFDGLHQSTALARKIAPRLAGRRYPVTSCFSYSAVPHLRWDLR